MIIKNLMIIKKIFYTKLWVLAVSFHVYLEDCALFFSSIRQKYYFYKKLKKLLSRLLEELKILLQKNTYAVWGFLLVLLSSGINVRATFAICTHNFETCSTLQNTHSIHQQKWRFS